VDKLQTGCVLFCFILEFYQNYGKQNFYNSKIEHYKFGSVLLC